MSDAPRDPHAPSGAHASSGADAPSGADAAASRTAAGGAAGDGELPTAQVVAARSRPGGAGLVLPALAVLLAIALAVQEWGQRGLALTVVARAGHGIEAGDALRYRGIQVGEVDEVRLTEDLEVVEIEVRLEEGAEALARSGSRFWLVRPQLGLDEVQGVETIFGSRYLAVLPGPADAPEQRRFVALEEPPVLETVEPGGLQLVLEAPRRFGLAPGAPVAYRGIRVGTVLGVELASDATSVEVLAYVRPAYAPLVRRGSCFWQTSGFRVDVGLRSGIEMEIESLRSLLVGGVAFATPSIPGDPVEDGHRFGLAVEPQEDWLEWRPALPVGGEWDTDRLPAMLGARVSWRSGVFAGRQARRGWVLPVPGGLIGPADLLTEPDDAKADSTVLDVAGSQVGPLERPVRASAGLAWRAFDHAGAYTWPARRFAAPEGPVDCLLVGDASVQPLALDASRLAPADDGRGWRVEPGLQLGAAWHGAAVVSRPAADLVGVLLVGADGARIAVPPREWLDTPTPTPR